MPKNQAQVDRTAMDLPETNERPNSTPCFKNTFEYAHSRPTLSYHKMWRKKRKKERRKKAVWLSLPAPSRVSSKFPAEINKKQHPFYKVNADHEARNPWRTVSVGNWKKWNTSSAIIATASVCHPFLTKPHIRKLDTHVCSKAHALIQCPTVVRSHVNYTAQCSHEFISAAMWIASSVTTGITSHFGSKVSTLHSRNNVNDITVRLQSKNLHFASVATWITLCFSCNATLHLVLVAVRITLCFC